MPCSFAEVCRPQNGAGPSGAWGKDLFQQQKIISHVTCPPFKEPTRELNQKTHRELVELHASPDARQHQPVPLGTAPTCSLGAIARPSRSAGFAPASPMRAASCQPARSALLPARPARRHASPRARQRARSDPARIEPCARYRIARVQRLNTQVRNAHGPALELCPSSTSDAWFAHAGRSKTHRLARPRFTRARQHYRPDPPGSPSVPHATGCRCATPMVPLCPSSTTDVWSAPARRTKNARPARSSGCPQNKAAPDFEHKNVHHYELPKSQTVPISAHACT